MPLPFETSKALSHELDMMGYKLGTLSFLNQFIIFVMTTKRGSFREFKVRYSLGCFTKIIQNQNFKTLSKIFFVSVS